MIAIISIIQNQPIRGRDRTDVAIGPCNSENPTIRIGNRNHLIVGVVCQCLSVAIAPLNGCQVPRGVVGLDVVLPVSHRPGRARLRQPEIEDGDAGPTAAPVCIEIDLPAVGTIDADAGTANAQASVISPTPDAEGSALI